jgi:hypothetical protein
VVTDGHFRLEPGAKVDIVGREQDAPRPRNG